MLDGLTSQRIKIARVLCIFFVMYAHVNIGASQPEIFASPMTWTKAQYMLLSEVLGSSSVPLLTIISGYLLASSRPKPYLRLVSSKFRSLYLPMVLWSALFIAMMLAAGAVTGRNMFHPKTMLDAVNALFAITSHPMNYPLKFLRDLFVCMCISPLLIVAVRRFGVWALAGAAAVAISEATAPFLLRSQILLFFSIGLFLAGRPLDWIDRLAPLWFAGAIPLGIARIMGFDGGDLANACFDNVTRLFVAGSFWTVTRMIAARRGRDFFLALEPATFVAFCSHPILFGVFAVALAPIFGLYGDPLYPFYMAVQPFAGMAAGYLFWRWFSGLPGFALLNAGKAGCAYAPRLWAPRPAAPDAASSSASSFAPER